MTAKTKLSVKKETLFHDIRRMIEETRSVVAATVNTGLTMLYWQIGKRINEEILKGERAKYGEEIIATLSQELIKEYGQGFNYSALTRMIRFAEVFSDSQIVATLSQQLSWSHFKELLPLDKPLQPLSEVIRFYPCAGFKRFSSLTRIKRIGRIRADRAFKTGVKILY